jgi:hypothetical protein
MLKQGRLSSLVRVDVARRAAERESADKRWERRALDAHLTKRRDGSHCLAGGGWCLAEAARPSAL